ncbi:MAG TPA: hypothetical protein VN844_08650 [Pyrinomonadaceae bacterium]|nr:hypothetical protein [Pyrinomonadaceae bacterium]
MAKINARLIGQKAVQDKLYNSIYADPLFDVQALETSIAYNGFLKHERLIVARYDGEKFLVLEGNRRLTAVRRLFDTGGAELRGLAPEVRQSLQTLPCFVLEGSAINGSDDRLKEYHRAAEIYIGLRHLMGARRWEPASRYEFQARLIDEGWSISDVSDRFGRDKAEVTRDLKAQRLYRDFQDFERRSKIGHSLTYNAFAEAARAPSIMKWLGWSDQKMSITKRQQEETFFHYLISRLKARSRINVEEGEEETAEESAETIVRRLRDMLKLKDDLIEEALLDRDFDAADLLYEERRQGKFAKRIAGFIRALKRVTTDELQDNARGNKAALNDLIQQAQKTILLLNALLGR